MRVKIQIGIGEGLILPINYNHLLTGIIYRFLRESDAAYADFLHNEGYRAAEKRFKLFTFSQLMADRRRVEGPTIHFSSTLTWFVSSPVERFLLHFADTLLSEGQVYIGQHQLHVTDVSLARVPRFRPEMEFRCLSPIVMTTVREWRGKPAMHYCLPDDPALPELIRQNLIRKHEAVHGHAPQDDTLNFAFDANYIRRRQGRVTRLIDYKGVKVRGTLCPFRVKGSVDLIQTGYNCGFGDKNSVGFGMAAV